VAWEQGTKRAVVRIQSQLHCQKGGSADLKDELAEGFNIESAIFDWGRQRMDERKRLISAFYGKVTVNCQLISIFPDWARVTSHLTCHSCQSQESMQCNYPLISLRRNCLSFDCHCQCCLPNYARATLHCLSDLSRLLTAFILLDAWPRRCHADDLPQPRPRPRTISILLGQCPSRITKLHPPLLLLMCLKDGGLSVYSHKISRFVSTHSETYYSSIGIPPVSLIADTYNMYLLRLYFPPFVLF